MACAKFSARESAGGGYKAEMTATLSAPAAMTAGAVASVMPPMATSGNEVN